MYLYCFNYANVNKEGNSAFCFRDSSASILGFSFCVGKREEEF